MANQRSIPVNGSTDLVTFTIRSDGTNVPGTVDVLSISITKEVNRIPVAKVNIADGSAAQEDFPISAESYFKPGKELEILVGYHSDEKKVFKGIVVKNGISMRRNGEGILSVECRDKAFYLTMGRQSQVFTDKKDSDVIKSLISDGGVSVGMVEATQETHKTLVQHHATNWDFIVSRAEANGKVAVANDGKLSVKAPTTSGAESLSVVYGNTIIDFDLELDAREQFAGASAMAWDPKKQEITESKGSFSAYNGPGNLSASQISGVNMLDDYQLQHAGALTSTELKTWANAQLLKSRLAKVRGTVTFQGFADVVPDGLIKLNGLGDRFNGDVYVSGVRHEISRGNWLTTAQCGLQPKWFSQTTPDLNALPASGLLPAVSGLQVGLVQGLEDPEAAGRVKVFLPFMSKNQEGIWARKANFYAGNERGSFFMPEIGDEVLVGFLNEDPRAPVVLGALYSQKNAPPFSATDDNFEKGLVTKKNIKLVFDDEKAIVTIETPGGNKVVVDDDAKSISLTDLNGNSMVMDDSGITLKSNKDITLEATGKVNMKATGDAALEGMNVKINAQTQLTAKGTAGAELSASGQTVVKGAMVMIN